MKLIRRLILAVVVLAIIAAVTIYMNLNRIVRQAVEYKASDSLQLQTTLGSANLGLFGGSLSLGNLEIASPKGFAAPKMLSLDSTHLAVKFSQLRGEPIRISELTLDKPRIVVEQLAGKFNFQTLMDLPANPEPTRLIIDKLTINNASVVLRPGLPGLDMAMNEITVPIPSMTLSNIGNADGAQNGAAIKQVALEVITSLVDKAGQAGGISDQLKGALQANAQAVQRQLISKVTGDLDKNLKGLGLPGVGDALSGQLDKAIGGKQEEKPAATTPKKKKGNQ